LQASSFFLFFSNSELCHGKKLNVVLVSREMLCRLPHLVCHLPFLLVSREDVL
jgi:hypothetical protein